MQKKTEQFLKLHTDILNSGVLDMYGKYIYIYILQNTDSTGYCRRSYYAISDATGISVSKVKASIKTLVCEGIIKKISGKKNNGSYDVNRYYAADTSELWNFPVRADRKEFIDNCFNAFITGANDGIKAVTASVRPFVKVSYEFLNNKMLSIKEKLMYICLASFKNRTTKFCFPSLKTLAGKLSICKATAAKYINLLTSKGIIKKRSYYNSNTGARSSTRYEFCSLPTPPPDSEPEEDTNNSWQHIKDCKESPYQENKDLEHRESPPDVAYIETWTDENIRDYFKYPELLTLANESKITPAEVDYVLDIIRHNLNSKDKYFTYKGEQLPMSLLKTAYLKLGAFNILYVIEKYNKQTTKIKNPEAYIKILLYTAKAQEDFEIKNEVMHDLYGN